MPPAPRLSLVLPVYREAEHLKRSLTEIREIVTELGVPFEILVIDDGSPDDTWAILQDLATGWSELKAFRLSRNFGKEGALIAGLDASRGDAVIIMDADLQHPPSLIPEMYRLWADEGYDVVNAVKRQRGDESWFRRRLTRLYHRAFEAMVGVKMVGSSDYKLLARSAVDSYRLFPERNTFFRGLVGWLGLNQADVFFDVAPRAGGSSSWSLLLLAKLAINSVVGFTAIPLQAVTVIGVGFLLFAIVIAAQTLWAKLSGGAVEGFATVILLQLLIGAILMIGLGIVGQYIAKIFDEVKRRPRYLIREEVSPRRDLIAPREGPGPAFPELEERRKIS